MVAQKSPPPLLVLLLDPGSGIVKSGSGIRDKQHESATLCTPMHECLDTWRIDI